MREIAVMVDSRKAMGQAAAPAWIFDYKNKKQRVHDHLVLHSFLRIFYNGSMQKDRICTFFERIKPQWKMEMSIINK